MEKKNRSAAADSHYRCFSVEGEGNILAPSDYADAAGWKPRGSTGCLFFHDDLHIKVKSLQDENPRKVAGLRARRHEAVGGDKSVVAVKAGSPRFVERILAAPPPDSSPIAAAVGNMVDFLSSSEEPDVLGFFENLVKATARAGREGEATGNARALLALREEYQRALSRLSLSRFARLLKSTFDPRFIKFKVISRCENGQGASLQPSARSIFSLEMGAWDAFGAAVVEDANRRGIQLPKPDTRYLNRPLSPPQQGSLAACWKIVSAKNRESLITLATSALRIIVSLPAGDPLSCGVVLRDLRKALHIAEDTAGDAEFAELFENIFSALAMASMKTDPAAAMAMHCLCTWLDKDPDSTEVIHFMEKGGGETTTDGPAMAHDIRLMAKCLARGLARNENG